MLWQDFEMVQTHLLPNPYLLIICDQHYISSKIIEIQQLMNVIN